LASRIISAIARGSGDASARRDQTPSLILFRAAPRRDTKPLAKALIARFGTFAEALDAPEELLREIPGGGEAAVTELKLVRAAALRLMRGEVLDRPVLSSWAQVLDYCRAVPHPVPGQAQPNHRRRGAADRYRRPHPRLCSRGGEAGAEAVGDGRTTTLRATLPLPGPT
jgi:hypothetical protein